MVTDGSNGFQLLPMMVGGHRQTLLGYWHRRLLRWTLLTRDIIVDAEGRLLLRASLQPHELVLVARDDPTFAPGVSGPPSGRCAF